MTDKFYIWWDENREGKHDNSAERDRLKEEGIWGEHLDKEESK